MSTSHPDRTRNSMLANPLQAVGIIFMVIMVIIMLNQLSVWFAPMLFLAFAGRNGGSGNILCTGRTNPRGGRTLGRLSKAGGHQRGPTPALAQRQRPRARPGDRLDFPKPQKEHAIGPGWANIGEFSSRRPHRHRQDLPLATCRFRPVPEIGTRPADDEPVQAAGRRVHAHRAAARHAGLRSRRTT